jgi:hypothetical protein
VPFVRRTAVLALVAGLLAVTPGTAHARVGENPGAAVMLRTYRLALLSDPSYAAAVAPSAATDAESDTQVLAAKQALVDRLNQVYGPELAIRFTLAPGTVDLNLRNAAEATTANGPCGTQPCFSTDQLAAGCTDDSMRRTRYVIGQLVGARNYEIGHLLLGAATPGSSYPSSAGTEYRALGCSGSTAPTGDAFAIDRLAHELGHQLGASSTFDGTSCIEERSLDAAVEPGSGASVMGAAGTCGTDDLQTHPEPWFTATSQEEIGWYVTGDGLVPDDAVAAEVQSVSFRDFDASDSFKLVFGAVETAPITRGVNYTQDGVKAAVLAAMPGTPVSKVRPFWQTGVFDDRGFEVTFASFTNIVEPTVVPLAGTFTSQVNDIDAGGLQTPGGTASSAGNRNPAVSAGLDRTIPLRTPFALTGAASDPDADPLVYQWQQVDDGETEGLALTDPVKTDGPLLRSFAPVSSATRVFPDLAQVVAGNTNAASGTCAAGDLDCWAEWLPTAAYAPASMHFRLVARDQKAVGGGAAYDEVVLTVDKTTGPFRVTSQASPASVVGGSVQTVTWTANTAALAANVKISLSVDGGQTFPTVLLASTPNDGSQSVTLPETATAAARIKVEAVGNYFFDVSHADLTISAPPTGLSVLGMPASATTQYSDPLVFAFTAETTNAPLDSVVASQTGLPAGLTLAKTAAGAWAVLGEVTAAPGTYPVHLEVGDGTATRIFDRNVVVTREAATATYDGDTAASATQGGPDAVDVQLSATAAEVVDGTSASLATATATFTDQTTGDVLCAAVPVDVSGDASCTYAADLPASGGRTFQVVTTLGGHWTGSSSPVALVVTAPGPPTPTPPDTSISSAPPTWLLSSSTSVSFASTEVGSTFECTLDGATVPCSASPLTLSSLAPGSHRFAVAARDAEGALDATPASTTFTVPVDDRALTVGSGRWKRKGAAAAYRGTYTKVAARKAELTYRVSDARSLALVVGTAAGQGKVKVYLDGALVGKVDLAGPTAWSTLVPLTTFSSPRSGLVRIVTRSKRPVRIDGLGVSSL